MKEKRIHNLALLILTIFSLTGCGSGSSESNDGTNNKVVIDTGIRATSGYYQVDGILNDYDLGSTCEFAPYDGRGDVVVYNDFTASVSWSWNNKIYKSECLVEVISVNPNDGDKIANFKTQYNGYDIFTDEITNITYWTNSINSDENSTLVRIYNNGTMAEIDNNLTNSTSFSEIIIAYKKLN
jgi:hypothetical protein